MPPEKQMKDNKNIYFCRKNFFFNCKGGFYRCILSSIVTEHSEPPRMSFGPFRDVVHLSIDHQPLIIPAAVTLHLLPAVNTCSSAAAAAGLPRPGLLASASHPHCCRSTCTLKVRSASADFTPRCEEQNKQKMFFLLFNLN